MDDPKNFEEGNNSPNEPPGSQVVPPQPATPQPEPNPEPMPDPDAPEPKDEGDDDHHKTRRKR